MKKKEEFDFNGQLSLFDIDKDEFTEPTKSIELNEDEDAIWNNPDKYLNAPEIKKEKELFLKSEIGEEIQVEESESGEQKDEIKKEIMHQKLTEEELEECAKKVLECYDTIQIGGVMRCCMVSSVAAEDIRSYMEEKGYTKNHKSVKSTNSWKE